MSESPNRQALRTEVVTDPAKLAGLEAQWDRLLGRSGFDDVFSSYGRFAAWWDCYGSGEELRCIVVRDRDDVRLILPLHRPRGTRSLSLGDRGADYQTIVTAADERDAVQAAFQELGSWDDWDKLRLRRLNDTTPLRGALPHAISAGGTTRDRLRAVADLRHRLSTIATISDHPYVSRERLPSLRTELAEPGRGDRRLRRLARHGEVMIRRAVAPAEIAALVEPFVALHRSWASTNPARDFYADPAERAMLDALVERLGPTGSVRIDTLELGGELAAAHMGFEWAGRLLYYRPCFDPALGPDSPGAYLLRQMILGTQDCQLHEVDLLKGTEAYKLEYADQVRPTVNIDITRSRWATIVGRLPGR